jgi:hypothetical protein
MPESTGTIFTVLLFIAAFFGSGAYAVLSMADFQAARRGFWAAAVSFVLIGLVLGLMTTWPLPVRIIVGALFAAAAIGSLIWILDYLKVRESLGIVSVSNQPDVLILPPIYPYKFSWQASSNLEMVISPERPPTETSPLRTAIPIFRIKNIGSVVAKDVTVEWTIGDIDIKKAVENSARLREFVTRFTDKKFAIFNAALPENVIADVMTGPGIRGVIARPPYSGYFMVYSSHEHSTIPYLAPEINNTGYQESDMPVEICQFLELYIVATILDGPPLPATVSVPIAATVKWKSPDGGEPAYFRIIAAAMNITGWALVGNQVQNQTKDIEAQIRFTVSAVS